MSLSLVLLLVETLESIPDAGIGVYLNTVRMARLGYPCSHEANWTVQIDLAYWQDNVTAGS
jgi:hypothetical protein